MGLKIMVGKDGTVRGTWHGQIMCKGKWHNTNLNVPIAGTIPRDELGNVKLGGTGDAAFERSRKAAQKAFDAWRAEIKKDPAELEARAYKARTGVSLEAVPLSKLAERWCARMRKRKNTADWQSAITTWFGDFATFAGRYAAAHGKRCETINDITPEIATAWFEELYKRFTWETVTKKMGLMRNAFRIYSTNGRTNPFSGVVMQNGGSSKGDDRNPNGRVSHKPLIAAELDRLFECARDDSQLYPLIVTAACTGMRVGDVCNLKWADVDLRGGFIDVVTAKAGVRATIPVFGRLVDVLNERATIAGDGEKPSAFVFPAAAARYNSNPDGLYRDVKPYFARAVFGNAPDAEPVTVDADGTADAATPRVLADVIGAAGFSDVKRTRLLDVYARFKAGERSADIAAALGVARSQVSMDLREIEKLTGENLRPRAMATQGRKTRLALTERTRQARGVGQRAASLYGWHSLRATFVVLALEAGVPLADVQKVVGHSTAEMTLQYFNPEKKHAAERVRAQMAGTVLDGGADGRRKRIGAAGEAANANAPAPVTPSIDSIIAGMSDKQRKALAAKLLGL